MKQATLDENGLPTKGSRNPSGMLSVKLSDEDWARVMDLMTVWSQKQAVRLSIGDVIRACLVQAHRRTMSGVAFVVDSVPPGESAPEPPGQKATRRKRSRRPTPGGT